MCDGAVNINGISDHTGEFIMELLRNWLIGITVSAVVAAMADSLIPDGPVKKVGKLTGGLLIMLAVLQPLGSLDYASFSEILVNYRVQSELYDAALETANIQLIKNIIEEETAAYILDKATELGINCEVEVTCAVKDKTPYPESVVVSGDLDDGEVRALSGIIEGDIAISLDNQRFERTKES